MKLQEIDLTKEYYAIPAWHQSNHFKKDVLKSERRYFLKVKVQSLEKFEPTTMKVTTDDPSFFDPPSNPRTYGLKVKDENGNYWVCKPADIVFEVAFADQSWKRRDSVREEQERIEREKRERHDRMRELQRTTLNLANESLKATIQELLQIDTSKISTDVRSLRTVDNEPLLEGVIYMPTQVMQALIEKVYELREAN